MFIYIHLLTSELTPFVHLNRCGCWSLSSVKLRQFDSGPGQNHQRRTTLRIAAARSHGVMGWIFHGYGTMWGLLITKFVYKSSIINEP